jgi:RNA polymerase sigma-70 factor (ECF subfamily)
MCEDREQPARETDASLVRRLQAGEMAAFDALFERFRRKLLAYVLGLLHDRGQAEDVVQESFVELVTKIRKIDADRGVSPWLYRVARNRAIDLLRHRRFEVLPGDDYLAETVADDDSREVAAPNSRIMARERKAEVAALLGTLPDKERDLLMLRFYGDLTFAEIAQVVRRPLGTVLWQVNSSLKKLRKKGRAGASRE